MPTDGDQTFEFEDEESSPTKQRKVGFLKARLNNYMAKKYKGEKRRRHVQNILGIE